MTIGDAGAWPCDGSRHTRHHWRSRFGALALLTWATGGAVAAVPDGEPTDGSGLRVAWTERHSTWRERDAAGDPLLVERGTLAGPQLGWGWSAPWGRLSVQAQRLEGVRDYDGLSSLGTPTRSRSDVEERVMSLRLEWPFGRRWHGSLAVRPTWLTRKLRDAGTTLGYAEQWRWTLVSVGVGWRLPIDAGVLDLGAEVGAAWRPRMTLALPGRDEATVKPRNGVELRLGLDYRYPLLRRDSWRAEAWAGWQWQGQRFDASAAVPLTSGGVLRGAVWQPESILRDTQWHWGLRIVPGG